MLQKTWWPETDENFEYTFGFEFLSNEVTILERRPQNNLRTEEEMSRRIYSNTKESYSLS